MPTFVRIGTWVFCLLCIVSGLSVFFIDDMLLKQCRKTCGITHALINIFGKDVAKAIIAAMWLAGAGVFGWLALRALGRKSETPSDN